MGSTAYWYKVIKAEDYIGEWLDALGSFHDHRIQSIHYDIAHDSVDIILQYDNPKAERILLRFFGIRAINIYTDIDYEADWLFDAELILTPEGTLIWVNCELTNADEIRSKNDITWVEADRLSFCLIDSDNNTIAFMNGFNHAKFEGIDWDRTTHGEFLSTFRLFEDKSLSRPND